MSKEYTFNSEEIGELIEFLRKEGLDPCDDAADLIEQQQSELSALRQRVRELSDGLFEAKQTIKWKRLNALLSTGSAEPECNRERNPDKYPADIDDAKGF